MLPPDFAGFGFVLDAAGADGAVADRAHAALAAGSGRRIVVIGAQRWGLVAALVRTGLDVTAIDASRAVLGTAKQALEAAGLEGRATFFATDPRDVEIPGGADAILVTSAMWRMLLHVDAQRSALMSFGHALLAGGRAAAPGVLLLDLDRVPELPLDVRTHLRDGPGRQRWTAERRDGCVRVRCASPGVEEIPLDLSAMQPETAIDEARAAGYKTLAATDAEVGGTLLPASRRMWLVARKAPR